LRYRHLQAQAPLSAKSTVHLQLCMCLLAILQCACAYLPSTSVHALKCHPPECMRLLAIHQCACAYLPSTRVHALTCHPPECMRLLAIHQCACAYLPSTSVHALTCHPPELKHFLCARSADLPIESVRLWVQRLTCTQLCFIKHQHLKAVVRPLQALCSVGQGLAPRGSSIRAGRRRLAHDHGHPGEQH